jgi:hypothetical protein
MARSVDREEASAIPVSRTGVLGFRFRRHGLHHGAGTVATLDDLALLDYGVQDTGTDGAAWALTIRGLDVPALDDRFLLAWTLRGAPHAYRRAEAHQVAVATAPFSEADAAKRVFDASKPLKAAGLAVLDALGRVAATERDLVDQPLVKGELSTALTERLDEPFLRWCRPCQATHAYEQPFRLAALQAGLELVPGTSPPVLRRAEGLEPLGFAVAGSEADPRVDVVRAHLRFYGPTTPGDVAGFLDAPVKDVRMRWPGDVVDVDVAGLAGPRHVLASDLDELADGPRVESQIRLLGPYDPYLQLRDRELLVPDPARRSALWPVLGRPGAVVDGTGEVLGTWRPKASGRTLTLRVEPWTRLTKAARARIDDEAERLAAHRGVTLRGVDDIV